VPYRGRALAAEARAGAILLYKVCVYYSNHAHAVSALIIYVGIMLAMNFGLPAWPAWPERCR